MSCRNLARPKTACAIHVSSMKRVHVSLSIPKLQTGKDWLSDICDHETKLAWPDGRVDIWLCAFSNQYISFRIPLSLSASRPGAPRLYTPSRRLAKPQRQSLGCNQIREGIMVQCLLALTVAKDLVIWLEWAFNEAEPPTSGSNQVWERSIVRAA